MRVESEITVHRGEEDEERTDERRLKERERGRGGRGETTGNGEDERGEGGREGETQRRATFCGKCHFK